MIRYLLVMFCLMAISFTASAIEAPSGQVRLDANNVLRGRFVEEHQANQTNSPLLTSGHVVVAPGHGLIWGIEKPFPTSTIITPNAAIQDIGGFTMKLPVKNLRALYDMVGGALAGDWNELEKDFVIASGGDANHWQMILTPRQDGKTKKLPYTTITVSGSHFVQNIVMTKADGGYDTFSFSDEALSSTPLTATEIAAFGEVPQ